MSNASIITVPGLAPVLAKEIINTLYALLVVYLSCVSYALSRLLSHLLGWILEVNLGSLL